MRICCLVITNYYYVEKLAPSVRLNAKLCWPMRPSFDCAFQLKLKTSCEGADYRAAMATSPGGDDDVSGVTASASLHGR